MSRQRLFSCQREAPGSQCRSEQAMQAITGQHQIIGTARTARGKICPESIHNHHQDGVLALGENATRDMKSCLRARACRHGQAAQNPAAMLSRPQGDHTYPHPSLTLHPRGEPADVQYSQRLCIPIIDGSGAISCNYSTQFRGLERYRCQKEPWR